MPRKTKKLISRLVTNQTHAFRHETAVDPDNPGEGPGSTYGWEDCDPEKGKEVLVDPRGYFDGDGQWVDADYGEGMDGLITALEVNTHTTIPGSRAEGRDAGQQVMFGQYINTLSGAFDTRNTPVLVESFDRLFQAESQEPESWVVNIGATEILSLGGPGTYQAKPLSEITANGNFYSILKARIRSGTAGERYVDVDIARGTRIPVEGRVVSVSVLTPEGYFLASPTAQITVPVAAGTPFSVLTSTNVYAEAYVTETAPEGIATYTTVAAYPTSLARPLKRIEIPPRAESVTVYTNIEAVDTFGTVIRPYFDDVMDFGANNPLHTIIIDTNTLRAEEVVIPKNSREIVIPPMEAAADTQFTFVFNIR